MNELISIIIPVYKVESYLHRCIDSVLRQSYKNLEIILVDDGSPDRCGEIVDEYARLDHRIKVIHKSNGGLSDARNRGIEVATGDYISFIDSDDWMHDEYIERLYNLIKETNSDISVCNYISTSTENIQVSITNEKIYEFSNIEALHQLVGSFYVQMIVACLKLYKKDLFLEVRFPVGRIHEDEFTTYKLIYKAKKITLTTAQLVFYWQRQDSITGSGFNIKHKLDALDAIKERAEFFRDIGLEDLSIKTCKMLFYVYMIIHRRIHDIDNIYCKERLERDFKDLRDFLRKKNKSFKLKVFYELYFVVPKVMYLVYIIFRRLRGIINHLRGNET